MCWIEEQGWDKTLKIGTNETIWILKLSDEENTMRPGKKAAWRPVFEDNIAIELVINTFT
jgi:hypothetical protein